MTARVPHSGLLLSDDDVALLRLVVHIAEPAARERFRANGLTWPAQLVAVLDEAADVRVPLGSLRGTSKVPRGGDVASATEEWITTAEASKCLSVSTSRVTRLARAGRLTGEQVGSKGPWRIKASSVDEYARTRRRRITTSGQQAEAD